MKQPSQAASVSSFLLLQCGDVSMSNARCLKLACVSSNLLLALLLLLLLLLSPLLAWRS
jgi:hypothetical protein